MLKAHSADVAGAGGSAFVPGGGVVEVGAPGGLAAVGLAAGLVAGLDVLADPGGGPVGGGGGGVRAAARGLVRGGGFFGSGGGAAGGAQDGRRDAGAVRVAGLAGLVQGGGGGDDGDAAGDAGGAAGAGAQAAAADPLHGDRPAARVGHDDPPLSRGVSGGQGGEREGLRGTDRAEAPQPRGRGGLPGQDVPGHGQVQQAGRRPPRPALPAIWGGRRAEPGGVGARRAAQDGRDLGDGARQRRPRPRLAAVVVVVRVVLPGVGAGVRPVLAVVLGSVRVRQRRHVVRFPDLVPARRAGARAGQAITEGTVPARRPSARQARITVTGTTRIRTGHARATRVCTRRPGTRRPSTRRVCTGRRWPGQV